MKNSEMIQYLENHNTIDDSVKDACIRALRKEQPQAPLYPTRMLGETVSTVKHYRCPRCCRAVLRKARRCHRCGQALKWSEEE